MEYNHRPVMLSECIAGLAVRPDGVYVDLTAGGAGHACQIARRLTTGRLLALDKDPDAVKIARQRLAPFSQATVIRADFRDLAHILKERGIAGVDGVLMDLGVSSYQLDAPERGFTFHGDGPLDMRMSKEGLSACDVVNTYPKESLERVIRQYGEEEYAGLIAGKIAEQRQKSPVKTTAELAEIVRSALPARARREKDPARKTFQAIRIEVNDELSALSIALDDAFEALNPMGRMAVITFHSLEDRIVKHKFLSFAQGCTCPPDFPVCVCGKKPRGTIITRKPLLPSQEELAENRRSRSAKLRIIEKNRPQDAG